MKIWKRFGKNTKKIPKAPSIQQVAIFGFADCGEDTPLFKSVVNTARALAEAGYVTVNGGGPGVMRAATVGAKIGGGHVIGVTLYPTDMVGFEGRDPQNHIDIEIKTDSYVERTMTLLKEGQVYVIFNGGTGTVSEFGMAWGMARLYFGHHKPLILYGKFWKKIMKTFKDNMMIRPQEMKVFKIVNSPEEVLEALEDFEKEIAEGKHSQILKTTRNEYSI